MCIYIYISSWYIPPELIGFAEILGMDRSQRDEIRPQTNLQSILKCDSHGFTRKKISILVGGFKHFLCSIMG